MSPTDKKPYISAYDTTPPTTTQETADRQRINKLRDLSKCDTLRNAKTFYQNLRTTPMNPSINPAVARIYTEKGTIERLWGKDGKATAALRAAQRASSANTSSLALLAPRPPVQLPLKRTSGNSQFVASLVPQIQPTQQQRLPHDNDFLTRMKSLNADLCRSMSKSRVSSRAATPRGVVDLTEENV